jgi:methanethiol S-methyltransferase
MNIVDQHLLLACGWLLWCVLHSVLIAESWMRIVRRRLGKWTAYYRLSYVLFSGASLLPVFYLQIRIESPLLWSWPSPLEPLQWTGVAVSAVIFLTAARRYDQRFFFGLRQISEHLAGRDAEFAGFAADGILRYMRHPYYSAGILLLLVWGDVTVATLIMKATGIGYFLVGAVLEERKLVARFGDAYRRYQHEVPMFIPRLTRRDRS